MDWYQLIGSSINIETGELDTTWNIVKLRKVIKLPDDWMRTSSYPSEFTKSFKHDDYYDKTKRDIIVDIRDLPRTWRFDTSQPEFNDKLIIDNRAYYIFKATDFAEGLAYLMTITHIKGTLPNQILPRAVIDILDLQQDAIGER